MVSAGSVAVLALMFLQAYAMLQRCRLTCRIAFKRQHNSAIVQSVSSTHQIEHHESHTANLVPNQGSPNAAPPIICIISPVLHSVSLVPSAYAWGMKFKVL